MGVQRMHHVGVVVDDLDTVVAFFLDVGLELEGRGPVDGGWVDRVVGLDGVRLETAMLRTPDGAHRLELARFEAPADDAGPDAAPANRLGFRHVAFVVDDLDGVLGRLRGKGYGLVGEVQDYEGMLRLCFVRGPEGLIVELADGAP